MIKEVDFQKTTETAFLKYASNVAQERAIPDVRDGLKIGLRQGLYAQFTNKLSHKDKFQKAQKSVAAAMSQSYVHGDVAMYDTFIRAARPWSYRYPVEDVQGSYGNPSSPDSHAAARYVEMRAGEIADYFFAGLKKNAIGDQWYSNYDDTEMIPSVFPSIGFWNIVNGCSGIAVAMATSVPTFNLREVNNALITLIENPNASFEEIYCIPDFPCGGTITNASAVKESLKNGKGDSIRIRAKLEYFPDQNMIKATELPYGVFTNTIIDQVAALTTENEDYGIERIIDHTKKIADIRIYLSKGVNSKKMIAKLYKDTSLENWYAVNMILLDKGRFPKVFGWREACNAYIEHIRECKRNEIQFDLDKALARKNIVDGLIKAYSIIDEVIATIKAANSPAEASVKLQNNFDFNEEQAKAILAMRLSALTKLDIVKLNDELRELIKQIEWLHYLLNDHTALDAELIKILKEVADKFGDERRTKVLDIVEEEEEKEEVKEEEIVVSVIDNKKIKINDKKKKGKDLLYTTNLNSLVFFTEYGKMYTASLLGLAYNKELLISDIIGSSEKILLVTDMTTLNSYHSLVTISKKGYIKKTSVNEYNVRAKKGATIAKLDDDDSLVNVFLSYNDNDRVIIAANSNHYNYYELNLIGTTGRNTKGVKAIKLSDKEYVVAAELVREKLNYKGIIINNSELMPLTEITTTSRAVKGQKLNKEIKTLEMRLEDDR